MRDWLRFHATRWGVPLFLFSACGALYLDTLAAGMLRGDSGEFQWAMVSLNVAHATGYPLFTLLGRAWLQIPLPGDPAWRLNLLAALFGASAVTVVFLLARLVTGRTLPAFAGAILLAIAPVFWFNASILEVYTLNALFLALILLLLWLWSTQPVAARSDTPLFLLFFIIGFALAHHRLTVIALPAVLVFLLLIDHRFLFNWRRLIGMSLMTLPGLALYLYVPLRLAPTGASTQFIFNDIILGREYAGSLGLNDQPLKVLLQIPWENFHLGLGFAVIGAIALWTRARSFDLLLALVLTSDVLFALVYSVPDVEVFLTPSFVVLAVWSAMGIGWLLESLAKRTLRTPRPLARLSLILASLLALAVALTSLIKYDGVRAQVAAEAGGKEERARAILSANVPRGALLELDWETATAVRYLQSVTGLRQDLEARLVKLNQNDEYWWALENARRGRPVYVESGVQWIRWAEGFRVIPAALDLMQVERAPSTFSPLGWAISDRVELTGLNSDAVGLSLLWNATRRLGRDLATYIHYFDADGNPIGQEDHGACCQALYGFRTSEWLPGRPMIESFRPAPASATYLQIGMYELNGNDIEPYGTTLYLQSQPISSPADAARLETALASNVTAASYLVRRGPDALELTVWWRADEQVKTDLTVFVHLLDASGKIVAQGDKPPLDGIYPTHAWRKGQTIRDTYRLKLAPGAKEIEFGLYDPEGGARSIRLDGKGDTIVVPLN